MTALEPIWQLAPCAALKIWREGDVVHWLANAAASAWASAQQLGDADWQDAATSFEATRVATNPRADTSLSIGGVDVPCQAVELQDGWLLWLNFQAPVATGAARTSRDDLALLDAFVRIGRFERDAHGGAVWWNAEMFRIFGLEAGAEAPAFDQVIGAVHPDDRQRLDEHRQHVLKASGRAQIRFRLLRPNGEVRFVHALTETTGDAGARKVHGVYIDETDSVALTHRHEQTTAQLAQALELAQVSVWRVDLQSRRAHYNDVGYRLAGIEPRPEGVDMDELRALAHPLDRQAMQDAADKAMASHEVVDVEARYRNPDGSYRHLLTRRVAQRDAHGTVVGLAGVSLNLGDMVAERERNQALARHMERIAEAAGVGVWSIEGDDDRVQWNEQMFSIYGLASDSPPPPVHEWMGQRVHAADRQRLADERRRARKSGSARFETEFRIVRPDGSLRWVACRSHRDNHAGRPVLHGIHLDMTRQRELDSQLQLQQERTKLATQSAGLGIWEMDLDAGTIIWDDQMYRLRGLEPSDPRPPRQIDQQLVSAADYAERVQSIKQHLLDRAPYELEFQVRWPDGAVHWLGSTGRAVSDQEGNARRMVGLNWDLTQRKHAESALRDKETAERASKAKTEFLSRMSHELRTPLNAVLGFAQLALHDHKAPLNSAQQHRVMRIHTAGAHLLALIDDVLDLASIEAGSLPLTPEPTSLRAAIDDVRRWTTPLATECRVEVHVKPGQGWVLADARRLRQVLTNLMSNALKYNRVGGEVWIGFEAQRSDDVDGWQISVRDTGRGMSAEQCAHLFEPFNRLGAERDGIEGRGLGLTTVRHLVALMGGQLQVHSQQGQGSEFKVWLREAPVPRARAKARTAFERVPTDSPPPLMSVLYIEDNAVNALLVQELMALRPNLSCSTAPDGISGVAQALRERPDLVLVDMQLPDINGYEVLRQLRHHGAGRLCIALSANAMPEDVARAKAAGFDDYWTKPIDFDRFLSDLDSLANSLATAQSHQD
ncbi:MAG: PAS domain-containing protein [Rubrivivax sp.]